MGFIYLVRIKTIRISPTLCSIIANWTVLQSKMPIQPFGWTRASMPFCQARTLLTIYVSSSYLEVEIDECDHDQASSTLYYRLYIFTRKLLGSRTHRACFSARNERDSTDSQVKARSHLTWRYLDISQVCFQYFLNNFQSWAYCVILALEVAE